MIRLIARRRLTHRGRAYRSGEQFEVPAIDAAALTYQGAAAFVPRDTSETAPPTPKRGTYRRRDLRAEE